MKMECDPKLIYQITALIVVVVVLTAAQVSGTNNKANNANESQRKLLDELKREDRCESMFLSKSYGYDLKTYKVITKDDYVLTLHRLVHPEDLKQGGPRRGAKKPYLLLHGLIGSSSSFIRNVDWRYQAPPMSYDGYTAVDAAMKINFGAPELQKADCLAERLRASYEGDKSASIEGMKLAEKLLKLTPNKDFCSIEELDFEADEIVFSREYKQAYKKFELNSGDAKKFVSNSLAFTLSNFGYDVWLLNLRGNYYSNNHLNFNSADKKYWDFDISAIINHDLPASIEEVKKITGVSSKPIGLVSYSYSAMHLLGFLTKFPSYIESLQPLVMMAPTLLTSKGHENLSMKYFMKLTTKALVSKKGPFPGNNNDFIKKAICSLPVASRLCKLFELIMHGDTESVGRSIRKLIVDNQQTSLLKKDVECGQTSTAVLHQLVGNLNSYQIDPKLIPWTQARLMLMKEKFQNNYLRRSVMLVHSRDDEVATPKEVEKIRNSALKSMTLVDFLVKEPHFNHVDFLFSKKNQYLINGEIAKMVTLYDYLTFSEKAHEPVAKLKVSRGGAK